MKSDPTMRIAPILETRNDFSEAAAAEGRVEIALGAQSNQCVDVVPVPGEQDAAVRLDRKLPHCFVPGEVKDGNAEVAEARIEDAVCRDARHCNVKAGGVGAREAGGQQRAVGQRGDRQDAVADIGRRGDDEAHLAAVGKGRVGVAVVGGEWHRHNELGKQGERAAQRRGNVVHRSVLPCTGRSNVLLGQAARHLVAGARVDLARGCRDWSLIAERPGELTGVQQRR